ncbi:MAG: hypothetical protein ACRD2A_07285, partial [Vicinamibacterales bacterium]
KYSLNRYNRSRTTGIAANYNPLRSETATLPWTDVNGDDIAQGTRGCTPYPSLECEISFAGLAANFGTAALNEYGKYPRTWNLESGLELQHELLSGLSLSASWWRGSFRNLTTTINQSWSLSDYSPYTWYNPLTGQPFTVYSRSLAAASRPTRNLDTFDPERRDVYESFNFEGNWRMPGGGRVFGGIAIERERISSCTSPDDPNYGGLGEALCDDFKLDIPFRPTFKMAASREIRWGVNLSMAFQNNNSPTSTRTMAVTRGTTRYPASCPAPCPAGAIIMPTGVFGQTSITYNHAAVRQTSVERIVQLDFKVSRTFRFGRVTVLPTFEVFNINNSDAIISYISTSALSSSYLAPNSIMQGRMYGISVTTRW